MFDGAGGTMKTGDVVPRKRRRAKAHMAADTTMPGAASVAEIGGQARNGGRFAPAPGGEGHALSEGHSCHAPSAPIPEIAGRRNPERRSANASSGEGHADADDRQKAALPASTPETAGQCRSDDQITCAGSGEGQPQAVSHVPRALSAEDFEIGGHSAGDDRASNAPGGEGQFHADDQLSSALSATIAELIALQRQRRFCIVSQSRCDRSAEAFIARQIGYNPDMAEADRKAVWAKASAVRKAVEKGGEGQFTTDGHAPSALSAAVPIILLSAGAREAWDKHRSNVEKRMRKLARSLPVWPFVESVAGFGDLGLAIIVGEAGDLTNYATKERVWKRLGLAVIDGERQQRRSNAEEAARHGYNPKRRAEVWTIADSLFRQQWRGAKDDVPAHAIGRYGEVYGARKAHTVTREGWTPKHRDNDARRVMTKALVEDLWKAWRQAARSAL